MANFLNFRKLWLQNPTLGASVKNQILCFEKAKFLFERSEFNFAETKIANFWQREHPVGDFSLVRFFWSSKEMNKKRFYRITNPNNATSAGLQIPRNAITKFLCIFAGK